MNRSISISREQLNSLLRKHCQIEDPRDFQLTHGLDMIHGRDLFLVVAPGMGKTLVMEEDGSEQEIPELKWRKDPWLTATTMVLVGLHSTYQYATAFPTLMGIVLFVSGAPSRVYKILSRIGLSVSYSTTIKRLKALAEDASTRVRTLGLRTKKRTPSFLVLWDNVNKQHRAWQTTLAHQNDMKNGTAATLVELEDIPTGALRLGPLLENLAKKERLKMTVDALRAEIDWTHIRGVGTGTILRIWLKHIPHLHRHASDVERLFFEKHAKHRLRLRKTQVHSLRCSAIDESTTVGTWQLLMDIIKAQLGIALDWLNDSVVLACGDQLTVHRLRKAKLFRGKCDTAAERGEPFVPVIQLWHLKWALLKGIFRVGFKPDGAGKQVYGMFHDAALLGREKFNHKKCDFYDGHGIVQDRFEALVLDALRLVCQEKTEKEYSTSLTLLEVVSAYFGPGGPLLDVSFDTLSSYAELVYKRYLTNTAYDAASSASFWQPGVYGPHGPASDTPGASSGAAGSARGTLPARSLWTGDAVLRNNISFLRLTFWYLEMCAAAAEGDIGRVFEIMKLLRFSFWGLGSTNYGNELLELAANFVYEFPPALREAIMNNYLVNPSGLPGHWHELDLLQEHFNYWLKRLFNSKSADFDSRFLREVVGLNLQGFCELRDRMLGFFGITKPGRTHTDADVRADINRLGRHYREDRVMQFCPGRNQPYSIANEFVAGAEKLQDGQLKIFLERTTADRSSVNDDIFVNAAADNLELADGEDLLMLEPANPLVSHDGGVTTIERFASDFGA